MKLNMSKTDWMEEKHMDTGILTDALKSGRVMWSESIVRTMNKVFP